MLPPPYHTASIGAVFLCLAVLFLLDLGSALQTKADGTAVSFPHPRKFMAFTIGFYRVDRYLKLLGDLLISAAGVTHLSDSLFLSLIHIHHSPKRKDGRSCYTPADGIHTFVSVPL